MNSTFFKHFFNYCIYALAILLTFLVVFEQYLELPALVDWFGHWHPLILHFPIVLILVTVIQYWRKDPEASVYLAITTISTLISAVTGFVLSMDSGSKGDLITIHQWLALAVCFILVAWYYLQSSIAGLRVMLLQAALLVLIVLTGHFGGMVTHGKDFLVLRPNADAVKVSLPEDPNIYQHIVQPILDRKCASCHNENKAKGELILTNHAAVIQGGKSGSILDESNGMLHRISLPLQDEEHMPPADEKQLDADEISVLEEWLELGASADLMFSELPQTSVSRMILEDLISESNANIWIDLPEVSNADIDAVSSEYCTIQRMFTGSNALQVILFPHKEFSSKELQKVKPIAENVVELNLSNLPLSEQDIKFLSNFTSLEHLNLSGTNVSDDHIQMLSELDKLKILKLYNTSVGDASVSFLSDLPALSTLYVYNTSISSAGLGKMTDSDSTLNVVAQAPEALEFKSILPSPVPKPEKYFFRNPFYLKLDHPLANIDIRYTVDGSDPDAGSMVLDDSLFVDKTLNLKFFAAKEGWESSSMDSMRLLRSSVEPRSYELVNPADKKYTGSGKLLLFDLKKGPMNFGDDAWMAYKDEPFILTCELQNEQKLNKIILSSMVHTDPYIFPPSTIKVYGGVNPTNLRSIGALYPEKLTERKDRHFRIYEVDLKGEGIKFLRIEVTPLSSLPVWHAGKGERGWFFIDEVILVEN